MQIDFKKIINYIISPTQSAYIKGRFIGENSRLVFDTIAHVNREKESGLIMAADFEAAFETVSWSYLRTVLEEMNFGNNFIKLINTLYLNESNFSRILLNGFLGEKIYMQRGIRQGDPVSGYLFNIAAEILAKQMTESNKFTGIKINSNTEIRLSQYADDTIIFLDGSKNSMHGVAEELSEFSSQSGLKLNWEKTSCMPIGLLVPPEMSENSVVKKIKWVNEIKILGICYKSDMIDITELNINKKLLLLENEIAQWNRRHITPLGKITVIKSLLLSKLVHLFMALPNPSNNCIKKIEQMLYRFLWNNKPDRIKRRKMIQKYSSDGLQMTDLKSFLHSLKLSWIRRLANSTASWTALAKNEQLDAVNIMSCGSAQLKRIEARTTNAFWKDVIKSLIQFNQVIELEAEQLLTEQMWFSDYTKFHTSIVPHWNSRGLRFIGDLINPRTGNILTREEIKRQYRIAMTFLCYESLIRSLPDSIKSTRHKSFVRPNIPFRLQLVLSKPCFSHFCYSLFVNALNAKCSISNNVEQKWMRDIGFYSQGSLVHVKESTKSPYLIYLHYRVISRIITTNKLLYAIKISSSNLCTFCKQEIETIAHLFWHCPVTQTFISDIDRHMHTQYNIRFQHSIHSWFFPQKTDELQTLLITLTKAVIYKARNSENMPGISHLFNSIRIEAKKEKLASEMKDRLDSFKDKWKQLRSIACG